MKKIKLALLSGGISPERDVSLKSGEEAFNALDKEKYDIVRFDPKTDIPDLVKKAPEIDAALIIMHGAYGEDGTIQGLLDLLKIPYQGSGVLGSALAMNKLASKKIYEQAGLFTPPYVEFRRNRPINPDKCIETIGLPLVIKPAHGGSSIGMTIARSKEDLEKAIDLAFEHEETVFAESCIEGIELTCGVIGNEDLEPLPVIEIVPGEEHEFFDYHAKYTPGATNEICPARIPDELTRDVQQLAIKAHNALFCKGYSRTDMILKDGRLYILETNTIPGMTANSLLPLSARTAGISFGDLLDRLIQLSLQNNSK